MNPEVVSDLVFGGGNGHETTTDEARDDEHGGSDEQPRNDPRGGRMTVAYAQATHRSRAETDRQTPDWPLTWGSAWSG